jgi:hypothetical protein
MNKKIVLDFDGVLINSHNELLINAYNTASSNLLTSINDIPKSYLELFLNNRSFVRSAGEMTALAIWCLENIKNPSLKLDLEQFQELYSTWNNLKELEERFFANRSQLADLLKEAWLNLHQPYQPLWSCLQKYQNEFFIVTQKNKQAVIDICAYFNLVIDSGNIYSGDNHKNKIDNFIILDKAHIDSSFLFIDDNLRNLIDLKDNLPGNINIEYIFADWGYGSSEDAILANKNLIKVCDQELCIKLIEGMSL